MLCRFNADHPQFLEATTILTQGGSASAVLTLTGQSATWVPFAQSTVNTDGGGPERGKLRWIEVGCDCDLQPELVRMTDWSRQIAHSPSGGGSTKVSVSS